MTATHGFFMHFKPRICKDGHCLPPRPTPLTNAKHPAGSVLAWPAWLRVLAVTPALGLLWLAVNWASLELVPW
jgi:hypothetical protein